MQADFSRNLGLLNQKQQDALRVAKVAVCGVGGMGGIAVEALCRMGVGTITIADHDNYEPSNINRQLQCLQSNIGKRKTEVIAERLRDINPELIVKAYEAVSARTVPEIVADADIVINGMDCIRSSLILEREARRLQTTIVDAWITPFASVFVMKPDSPHWEEFLDFPTRGRDIDEITDDDVNECLRREVKFTLSQFHSEKYVDAQLVEDVLAGRQPHPSLVPVVWLSGIMIANEAMKVLTAQGTLASHWGVFYDQYEHRISYFNAAGTVR